AAWQTASLEALDLVGLIIDGVHIGEHCLMVALGIAADGQKHAPLPAKIGESAP
ncbi:MAG: IS256 family transposase, partial [Acidobacteria bacterium]|nr:IS256 family transposase [Acidobacteriota bacterium]